MILIADSGATKTDWCYGTGGSERVRIQTEGINPVHQSETYIRHIIEEQLFPSCEEAAHTCTSIYFYGAGCLPSVSSSIREALQCFFPKAHIEVKTDLTGAARALCQNRPGIACILGTGSNSWGDEGSGAYLGKRFVADCWKGQLPIHLRDSLLDELQMNEAGIIDRVYRQPQANRFLASLCPFIHRHKGEEEVHVFLMQCFGAFFRRNVLRYSKRLPVSFVGSIAWHFRTEIEEAAQREKLETGVFLQSPIGKLADYHLHQAF